MKKHFYRLISIAAIVYVLFGIYLYLNQKAFLYFPTAKAVQPFPVKVFAINGEKINVIVANPGKEQALIYFGGNAESVGYSSERIAHDFPHYTAYLVNYRGYGGSSGEPSEKALFADALALYDQIKNRHKQISVAGRSLGSGVAAYLSAQRKVDKLALITPFDSIESVAKERFAFYPVSMMLKDKYDSRHYMEKTTAKKILILLAGNDKVVPRDHSMRLIEVLPKKKTKVVTIDQKGHTSISDNERYYEVLRNFFGKMGS